VACFALEVKRSATFGIKVWWVFPCGPVSGIGSGGGGAGIDNGIVFKKKQLMFTWKNYCFGL
jgi:hypothetical protein